ncbi:HNH endonuclease signature motif containing protein [Weissella cibaria]|nr:HNH endonuclease signature motif containing protein [Weissella cibaria]
MRRSDRDYPDWFRKWQRRFYNSKEWKQLRDEVRRLKGMRSDMSGSLIKGKSIVDHIIPITPMNYLDSSITLNLDNLQLLSLEEHNQKTFNGKDLSFEPPKERRVNLF